MTARALGGPSDLGGEHAAVRWGARRSAPGPRVRSPPTRAGLLLNDPPALGGDPYAASTRRQLDPAPRDGKGEHMKIGRPLHDHPDRAPHDQRAATAHRFTIAMELAHHC